MPTKFVCGKRLINGFSLMILFGILFLWPDCRLMDNSRELLGKEKVKKKWADWCLPLFLFLLSGAVSGHYLWCTLELSECVSFGFAFRCMCQNASSYEWMNVAYVRACNVGICAPAPAETFHRPNLGSLEVFENAYKYTDTFGHRQHQQQQQQQHVWEQTKNECRT